MYTLLSICSPHNTQEALIASPLPLPVPSLLTRITTRLGSQTRGQQTRSSEEVSDDLATGVLPPRLLVVHDAIGSGQHEVTELPGGEDVLCDLVQLLNNQQNSFAIAR